MEAALSMLDNPLTPATIATMKPNTLSSDENQIDFFLHLLVERTDNKANAWKFIIRMKSKYLMQLH